MIWTEDLKFDERGLLPVVAQDAGTGEVLMLAYADREALRRTLDSGRAHYWSRSRAAIWQKGETSGHTQRVVEVRLDCDGDAVLYRVMQTGPACHTGEPTCFHRRVGGDGAAEPAEPAHVLSRIEAILRQREAERPEGSYTAYLFDRGMDKVLKKLGEETTEAVIAAKNGDNAELTAETSDLLFHLLVLLRIRDLPLSAVWAELESRFGAEPRLPRRGVAAHPHS
jgi:phosphoribosyl-AMP cyclohydrolase / phosphoribosyl-ATP pyrophosphohydrolase